MFIDIHSEVFTSLTKQVKEIVSEGVKLVPEYIKE